MYTRAHYFESSLCMYVFKKLIYMCTNVHKHYEHTARNTRALKALCHLWHDINPLNPSIPGVSAQ